MVVPWAHVCLLAACLPVLVRRAWIWGWTGISLLIGMQQTLQLLGRGHTVNPYRYVATSRDIPVLADWLQRLRTPTGGLAEPLAVVGAAYWPLPWYLREVSAVGYFASLPEDPDLFPVLLVMAEQADIAATTLSDSHTGVPRSLRENTPLMVYVRNDVWSHWSEQSEQVAQP